MVPFTAAIATARVSRQVRQQPAHAPKKCKESVFEVQIL
ncbi:hypothetical protein HMPREF1492_1034 [Atopobium sp. BS2]|nr:hypothetical protein HMPREF1492_1034 [Atopobium sp. BS2]